MLDNEKEGLRERKKAHRIFFVCCDTERTVLWLNTIILLLNMFKLTAAIMQSDRARSEGYTKAKAMIVSGCDMFVTFTLLGAYWYSKSIIHVGLVHTCYQLTVPVFKVTRYNWERGYNEDGKLEVMLPVM